MASYTAGVCSLRSCDGGVGDASVTFLARRRRCGDDAVTAAAVTSDLFCACSPVTMLCEEHCAAHRVARLGS